MPSKRAVEFEDLLDFARAVAKTPEDSIPDFEDKLRQFGLSNI